MTILADVVRRRSTPRLVAIGLYVFAFAAIGAAAPYLPVFYESLGLPLNAIGLLTAAGALCGLVAAPIWGVLADEVAGSRLVLVVCAAASAVCAAGLGLAAEAALVAVIAILYALAFAGIAPVLDAYALDQLGANQHRYARFRVWGSASFVVAVVAVGLLIQFTQLRSMFVALFGVLVVAAVLALMVRARTSVHVRRDDLPRSGLGRVLRTRQLMLFVIAVLVAWSASTMVNGFLSIYLTSLNAPAGLVGSAWAIGAIVEVPVMLAFPALAARFGVAPLTVVGAGFLLLRVLVLVATSDPYIATAAMTLHGFGYALLLVGGVTYVARLAPPGSSATAQGVLAGVVFGLAQAVGPGVGGLIADVVGIQPMFTTAAIASAAGVLAVWAAVSVASRQRAAATAP